MFAINHRNKFNFIRLKDLYYAPEVQKDHTGYDAVYYFNCKKPTWQAKEFKTMLINLKREPDEILKSFRKKTRVEINKALSDTELNFGINDHPSFNDLNVFLHGYNDFAAKKNLCPCNKSFLERLIEIDRLIIGTAFKEGKILCQFALIDAEEKTVCYYGYNVRFSNINDHDKFKLISRANRALEYKCMLHANKKGKQYYDLCGLTMDPSNPSTENVDQYKMSFKGQVASEYHFIYPITFKGRLFCWLKQLSGGIS